MKINNITTIVDLAFNLSGSLAGIPVILSQLPVGERVGFATLPKVWEDVDDIGQTWTPNLDGVEVDLTVEAYNPTAIQKAPYSTDLTALNVASEWGCGELLDDSDKFISFCDLQPDTSYTLYGIRILNQTDPILCAASDAIYNPYYELSTEVDGSNYFEIFFDTFDEFRFRFLLGGRELADNIPWVSEIYTNEEEYYVFEQSVEGWGFAKDLIFPSPVSISILEKVDFEVIDNIAPSNAWKIRDNVFVKIKP